MNKKSIKKKDNKKMINILLIILIPVLLIILLLCDKHSDSDYSKRRILIEKSYSNYAWSNTYKGMAICDDGTIYKWNMKEDYFKQEFNNSSSNSTLKYESDNILKYARKIVRKVSKRDMEKLKKDIINLNGYMSTKYGGNDIGDTIIRVWDYSKETEIDIKIDGDQIGENESEEAQEIIKITNKYLKFNRHINI